MKLFRQIEHVGGEPLRGDEQQGRDEGQQQEFLSIAFRPDCTQCEQQKTVQPEERKPGHEMRGVVKETKIDDSEKRCETEQSETIRPEAADAQLNDDYADERYSEKRRRKRFRVELRAGSKAGGDGHTDNGEKDLRGSRQFH